MDESLSDMLIYRAEIERKPSDIKFIYSKNATKFCEIFTLLFTTVHTVKSKVKISQNFVSYNTYMNFIRSISNDQV